MSKLGYNPIEGPRSTGPPGAAAAAAASASSASGSVSRSVHTSPQKAKAASGSASVGSNNTASPSNGSGPIAAAGGATGAAAASSGSAKTIYDRNLHRGKQQVALSSLSFLFMQVVSSALGSSKSLMEMERKLNNLGYGVGLRTLELTSLREAFSNNVTSSGKSNTSKRETRILEILQFIGAAVWKSLFDKPADNLEKSSDNDNQYMIIDNDPALTRFICMPKEYENLDCESFTAGIIEGLLDIAYFRCEVSAHSQPQEGLPNRTVYLIDFDPTVIQRERRIVSKRG